MVETAIRPVESLADYFNTAQSSMNPHNVGHTFYVYGTLPIFLVRYIAKSLSKTDYGAIYLVGRALSGIFDLLTVILVFFVSFRLYRQYRLSLVAAGFMAFAVLPIQLSHYFTVDTFANFFSFLTIGCAVLIMTANQDEKYETETFLNILKLLKWMFLSQFQHFGRLIVPWFTFCYSDLRLGWHWHQK